MADKDNRKILLILLLLALLFFLYFKGYFNFNTNKGNVGLSVQYYDANMNEIKPSSQAYAALTRTYPTTGVKTSGVAYINLSVYLVNSGTVPLTCEVTTADVTEKPSSGYQLSSFKNSGMNKWILISPGASSVRAWSTYSLISTTEFLPQTPATSVTYTFNVSVTCNDTPTNFLKPKASWLKFLFEKDTVSGADFTLTLSELFPGTTGTYQPVCNDGKCESPEDAINCPQDCATPTKVKFRTLYNYIDTTANSNYFAYTDTCGTDLITLKEMPVSNNAEPYAYLCPAVMAANGYSTKVMDLPSVITGIKGTQSGTSAVEGFALWKKPSDSYNFYLCGNTAGGNADAIGNKAYALKLSRSDYHAFISPSPSPINSALELGCS